MDHQGFGAGPAAVLRPEDQRKLAAAREACPAWDIYATLGGYIAIPKGTPIVSKMFLDGLVAELDGRDA
jgi:hypothetical protein